jgi:hypothetical protein
MLATQTADGDLRVWSVSKPPTAEIPRVIRVLKRPYPNFLPGRTWMAWSKNGRVLQYSESETWAWDVRTKHVTYEVVPTVDGVQGIAAFGPSATMFTLGPDHTVQQYDIEQGHVVQNVRNMPTTIPPTPPEEVRQLGWTTSESEEDAQSPVVRLPKSSMERNRVMSPQSQITGTASTSSKPAKYNMKSRDITSPARHSELTGTTFSAGTQATYLQDHLTSPDQQKVRRKTSRLRQEVVMSPEERPVDDLFPFTRSRLNDVPYKAPRPLSEAEMTPDNLRRQMLRTVFGWAEDIQDLIRDELSRHPPDSQHAVFLSKWLNEDENHLSEIMGQTGVLSNIDWMLLALGTLDHSASFKRISQVFIEKMLSRGDIHAAAAVLLCLGDKTDAIEVYVSRNQWMEAVLLTSLVTPLDWQRQSHLVRRWGEHVVENSQQQLAIRCFSCSGVESAETWVSPTISNFNNMQALTSPEAQVPNIVDTGDGGVWPEIYRKTLERRRTMDAPTPVAMPAPPTPFRTAAAQNLRVTPQNSALKLITSFGAQSNPQYKFPGLKSEDYTPTVGASVTPIAESAVDRSALSPGGSGNYRQNNARSLNAVMSARTPSAMHKHRLPSIGETPVDVDGPSFKSSPPPPLPKKQLPTPADSGSEVEKSQEDDQKASGGSSDEQNQNSQSQPPDSALLLLTPARYEPGAVKEKQTPKTAVRQQSSVDFPMRTQRPESRSSDLEELASLDQRPRTSSRSKKPDGLSIQMAPLTDARPTGQMSGTQPGTGQTFSTTQFDTNSELTSPPVTGDTMASRTKSPSYSSRSIDQYISSLEQAHYYSNNARSRETASEKMTEKRQRAAGRRASDAHDEQRTANPSKRSPSSPVPMSPEDLRMYTQSVDSLGAYTSGTSIIDRMGTPASRSRLGKHRALTSREEAPRHRSQSARGESRTKASGRGESRRRGSPDREGRSHSRKEGMGRRSPSSPLPMVPTDEDRLQSADSALRFVSADRQHRTRGSSRNREEPSDHRKHGHRSRSRQPDDGEGRVSRKSSVSTRNGRHRRRRDDSNARSEGRPHLDGNNDESVTGESSSIPVDETDARPRHHPNQLKSAGRAKDLSKEIAAAELEARRLSLARRPSAPNIPMPGQMAHGKSASESHAPPLFRANTEEPGMKYGDSKLRRPSTPRAMQVTPDTMNGDVEHGFETEIVLPKSVYTTPNLGGAGSPRPSTSQSHKSHSRAMSRAVEDEYRTAEDIQAALAQLPRHPAFDSRLVRSREHSRNRGDGPSSRGVSRDRLQMSPPLDETGFSSDFTGQSAPAVLPELQHLMSPPPPPPPPPAPPKDKPTLSIRTAEMQHATRVPLPPSANPKEEGASSAHPGLGHRRGRSNGGSDGQFMGKIKNFAGKMRSTSQGRDNTAKSPPQQWKEGSPYETNTTGFRTEPMQA